MCRFFSFFFFFLVFFLFVRSLSAAVQGWQASDSWHSSIRRRRSPKPRAAAAAADLYQHSPKHAEIEIDTSGGHPAAAAAAAAVYAVLVAAATNPQPSEETPRKKCQKKKEPENNPAAESRTAHTPRRFRRPPTATGRTPLEKKTRRKIERKLRPPRPSISDPLFFFNPDPFQLIRA